MKIVFFGTSNFASTLLDCLLKHKLNIIAVVTRTDKPQGRSLKVSAPPVKELIEKTYPGLPILQPLKASTPEFAEHLKKYHPDLFIVADYGEILKSLILDMPFMGAINVHGSMLPKYRGAAPIQRSLINGDLKTSVSIVKMVLALDAGDVLAHEDIDLPPSMTFGELAQKMSLLSCPLLIKVIDQIKAGTLQPVPQDPSQVTFAAKITPAETEIKWNHSAIAIHNLIRGISPQPGAWCWVQVGAAKKRLKIKRSEVAQQDGYFGENIVFSDKEWIVACGTGALKLLEVQLEGKKSLPIHEFLRGFQQPCKILT